MAQILAVLVLTSSKTKKGQEIQKPAFQMAGKLELMQPLSVSDAWRKQPSGALSQLTIMYIMY